MGLYDHKTDTVIWQGAQTQSFPTFINILFTQYPRRNIKYVNILVCDYCNLFENIVILKR